MSGILNMLLAGGGGAVNVSGETITAFTAGSTATAGVRFNTNGTVDKDVNLVYSQIDAATDWIRPTSAAPGAYEIMAHIDAGTLDAGSAAVDTWLALTSAREWFCRDTTIPFGGQTATLTISIRLGSTTLDSGVYSLDADRDDI